jgi:hypothetical protein
MEGEAAAKREQLLMAEGGEGGMKGRSRRTKNYSSFRGPIVAIAHSKGHKIKAGAATMLDGIARDLIRRLTASASDFAIHCSCETIAPRHVHSAVKVTYPGELATHALNAMEGPVTKVKAHAQAVQKKSKGEAPSSGKNKIRTSELAGLMLPVKRVEHHIRALSNRSRVGGATATAVAAAVEYVLDQVIQLAAEFVKSEGMVEIANKHIASAINSDVELHALFSSKTFGVGPSIKALAAGVMVGAAGKEAQKLFLHGTEEGVVEKKKKKKKVHRRRPQAKTSRALEISCSISRKKKRSAKRSTRRRRRSSSRSALEASIRRSISRSLSRSASRKRRSTKRRRSSSRKKSAVMASIKRNISRSLKRKMGGPAPLPYYRRMQRGPSLTSSHRALEEAISRSRSRSRSMKRRRYTHRRSAKRSPRRSSVKRSYHRRSSSSSAKRSPRRYSAKRTTLTRGGRKAGRR